MKDWRVMKNPIGGDEYIWQVYRIRDKSQPMHAGNIETTGKIYDSEAAAQAEADAERKRARQQRTPEPSFPEDLLDLINADADALIRLKYYNGWSLSPQA